MSEQESHLLFGRCRSVETTDEWLQRLLARLKDSCEIRKILYDVSNYVNGPSLDKCKSDNALMRIRYIRRYLASDEVGAARHEIQLLIGELQAQRGTPFCADAQPHSLSRKGT